MEIKVINPLRDDVQREYRKDNHYEVCREVQREYRKDNHYEVCREVTHVVVGLEVLWLKFGTGREEIDPSQVEAVTATGASRAQQLSFGIIPQILPAFAGISVFRWDINIRESTVLGLVGAGGIGLQLDSSISTLSWTQVSLILIVILCTVIVSEWVSARIRHSII
jgi:ABC-type nitrate/sulfonate/bicarbonate transport system permease component